MLFHVTMTHSEDNCPGFNPELIPAVAGAIEKREEIMKRHGVKLHWLVSAAPDHHFFALVEGDSLFNIELALTESIPFKQAFEVRPVITADELVKLGREIAARR